MASPAERTPSKTDRTKAKDNKFLSTLDARLTAAKGEREDATPEPIFTDPTVEPCYRLICEQKRAHFTYAQAERHRQSIVDATYWENEAKTLQAAAGNHLENVDWRRRAHGWRGLLKSLGVPRHEIDGIRRSIETQTYWKSEAEVFEREEKRLEMELKEKWRKEKERYRTRRIKLKPKTQGTLEQNLHQTTDRVSAWTRSQRKKRT